MNVSRLIPEPPVPSAALCPPRSREVAEVFPGAGDRIVTCRDPAGAPHDVLDSPDPRAAPPFQRNLATIGLGIVAAPALAAVAAPALAAIAEEGAFAAVASFGAKALGGLKDSVTQPEEIGKLVGGGVAFEFLKSLYERVAPAMTGVPSVAHDASRGRSHEAQH